MLTHSLTPRGPAPTPHTQPFLLHIPVTQSGVQTSNVSNRSTNMSKRKNYFYCAARRLTRITNRKVASAAPSAHGVLQGKIQHSRKRTARNRSNPRNTTEESGDSLFLVKPGVKLLLGSRNSHVSPGVCSPPSCTKRRRSVFKHGNVHSAILLTCSPAPARLSVQYHLYISAISVIYLLSSIELIIDPSRVCLCVFSVVVAAATPRAS